MNAIASESREVVLVRHGETEWSLSGRHTGITDLELTPNGEKGAKLLAPLLASLDFAAVLASPLQRARRTCELAGLGSQMQVDPDLVEWNYGDYEGLTPKQIHETAPGWLLFIDGCPGGEKPEEVGARVDALILKLRALDGRVALFGHGHVFRVLAARWIGLPVSEGRRFLLSPSTLSILDHYRNIPAVKVWNAPVGQPRARGAVSQHAKVKVEGKDARRRSRQS